LPNQDTGLTLDQLDVDGAIREGAEQVDHNTRAAFLRKAGVFGGSIVAGGAALGTLPSLASAKSASRDIKILNFALTLEYLESDFYKQGVRDAGLHGMPLALSKLVSHHEANHVRVLRSALGSHAVKKPRFDFRGTTKDNHKFLKTAFILENEGVAAYSGQGPRILSAEYLAAAISILTIEARHAAAFAIIRGHIVGKSGITPNGTFDKPKTMSQVLKDVKATHFIKG
jgi:hypothetical protein